MKPFNLEAAKRGDKIVDSYGKPLTYITHVPEADSRCRVVVMSRAGILLHYNEGGVSVSGRLILMAPKIKYVNLYTGWDNDWRMYDTKEDAVCAASDIFPGVSVIATAIPVEV